MPLQAPIALTTFALLAGCSSSPAIAPTVATPQSGKPAFIQQRPSFYSCPKRGSIEYLTGFKDKILVFAGKLSGQIFCGMLSSPSLSNPQDIFVEPSTHELYVANAGGRFNVVVIHRGAPTSVDNAYVDPTGARPVDVVVANDGTIVVSNYGTYKQTDVGLVKIKGGSLSTWAQGPNGGRFIGNFTMRNSYAGGHVTVRKNGTIYFSDFDERTSRGYLWSVSCPAGACGRQTLVTSLPLDVPGGMTFDATGNLLITDYRSNRLDTFELPDRHPKSFPVADFPYGVAINMRENRLFLTDFSYDDAREYTYPGGHFVGSVSCGEGCNPFGIAIDP